LESASGTARLAAGLRTIMEATWLPGIAPQQGRPAVPSAWSVFPGPGDFDREQSFVMVRRATKVVAVVLALFVASILLRLRPPLPHQLVGGMLAVGAMALITSETGAVANWAWLAPLALAALAARTEIPVVPVVPASRLEAPPRPGSMYSSNAGVSVPRITVER
jgi:hypothetical protein